LPVFSLCLPVPFTFPFHILFLSSFSLSTCLFFSLPYFCSCFPLILLCLVPLFVCI
jgi:hypothetical protein